MSTENEIVVITRELVKRAWTDIEPKLVIGLGTGTVAAWLASNAAVVGIHLTPTELVGIPLACTALAGWLVSSVGTTVTKTKTAEGTTTKASTTTTVSEAHTGATQTVVTGPIPIVTQPAPRLDLNRTLNTGTSAVAAVPVTVSMNDDAETQVLPSTPGASFLQALADKASN